MYFFKLLFKDFYHLWRTEESREFLKLAWKYGDLPRYQPAKVNFRDYQFDVPDAFSFLWQFYEIFVEKSYAFQPSNTLPIIYDCGANVGTSCIFFKELYPQAKVKAFEADPAIGSLLTTNLHRHNLADIEIINKAVWIHDEGLEIVQEGADGASAFSQGNKIKVPSVRLSDLLKNESSVDLLKIDIEGAEVAVLKDCKDCLHHVQNIFVEYHSFVGQPQHVDEVINTLKINGFRYYIKNTQGRKKPLINHVKNNHTMDLQLDIFGYRK